MLPNPNYMPASSLQFLIYCLVALLVFPQLSFPKLCVVFWLGRMYWTSMPETPVHKYHYPLLPESKVGFPENLLVSSPSGDVMLFEDANHGKFRVLVPLSTDF